MFDAGAIVGRLKLDLSQFSGGLSQATGLAGTFAAQFSGVVNPALLGAAGAAAATAAALLALGAAVGTGIKLAAEYEQATVALGTMLGSADRAKVLLKDLSDFAAATPFEFPELLGATRKLIAFGTSADDLIGVLKTVGDVSAGIGAPIGEIAELYGKAQVQGRLFAQDINQLTGRGIPIIQELARQFGVADAAVRGLVEAGKINFGHLQVAFQNMSGEGGKFAGLMAAQSATLSGLWSTVKDTVGIALREIGEQLVKTFSIKDGLKGAGEIIQSTFKAALPFLQGTFELLKGIGSVVGSVLLPVFRALAPVLKVVGDALGFIFGLVGKVLSSIGAVVRGVTDAVGITTAAGGGAATSPAAGGGAGGGVQINAVNIQSPPLDQATTSAIAASLRGPLEETIRRQRRETRTAFAAASLRGRFV